ncbi:LysM peptidoglycan-binding domain-containing protein [Streptomyces diastaticus]|uniref:Membrane protein n=2 Tax=Streptomyces TaxID=1883 RepID=A0ABQ1CR94_STRDI|nr:LysM peptidoglycan-binding domain-containing protein [Streptomyces diastaticus]GFH72892.1 membrane protein [Streptomyces diastaticus subsp. diastaticus]GGU45213.1 membrane protein [Streptomyces diastaticus subsp. diastaticus]
MGAGRAGSVLARAVGSVLGIALLGAGAPYLLWQATAAVGPDGLDAMAHLLSRQDTADAVLLVILAVGWLAWITFAVALLVEVPAQVRGRRAVRLPGLRLSQRAAGVLVTGVLAVLSSTAVASAAPSPGPAATAEAEPGQSHVASGSPATAERGHEAEGTEQADEAPRARPTYTVRDTRPAQSLWSIAEELYGDGDQFTRIADLNEGRVMVDGSRFVSAGDIRPGWELLLPEDEGGEERRSHADAPRAVTVAPGDTLSKIAEDELGDPDRYPEIFDLNRGARSPQGQRLTDADQIVPGQRLVLPPDEEQPGRQNPPAPPKESTPQPPAEQDERKPDEAKPAPSRTELASPAPSTTAPESPQPSTGTAAQPEEASAATPAAVRTTAGVTALTAAVVVAGLAVRRRLQQRRRKPGESIAMAPEASTTEQRLVEDAEPAAVTALDTALRSMARAAGEAGIDAPPLKAAMVTRRTIRVLPADPGEPVAPFTAEPEGAWWSLAPDAELLTAEDAATTPCPYPGLVTLGADNERSIVLLNLPSSDVVLLSGSAVEVREVCTSLVLEVAMSPWAEQAEVLAVGFGRELPRLMPTARLRHVPDAAAAARDLGEWLLERHQSPGAEHESWLLVCADSVTSDEAWQLAEALAAAPEGKVAMVLPASCAPVFPRGQVWDAAPDVEQMIEDVEKDLVLQRMSSPDYQELLSALSTTTEPAEPAEAPWDQVLDEPSEDEVPEGPENVVGDGGTESDGRPFPALVKAAADPASDEETTRPAPKAELPPASPENAEVEVEPASDASDAEPASAARAAEKVDAPAEPQLRVMGTVELTGLETTSRAPKLAALAALLYFRPGRDPETLCEAMGPNEPWSPATLNQRVRELRNRLGSDPNGDPYVLRRSGKDSPYALSQALTCDWGWFEERAAAGLAVDGSEGLPELESALSLVRGRPLAGRDFGWALPQQQRMISRIIDIAHCVAVLRTVPGQHQDLDAARHAIMIGLEVESTAELLYRDWMRTEHEAGNRHGLRTAITRAQQAARRLDCALEPETEELIASLTQDSAKPGDSARTSGRAFV